MCPAPLDAPRREIFIRIFKSAVSLSVSHQIIIFVCLHRTPNPAVQYQQFKTKTTQKIHAANLDGCNYFGTTIF